MKYTLRENSLGTYTILRYGEPATRQTPNNAELEFWLELQELREMAQGVMTWYDRDSSVGGTVDPMDNLRETLRGIPE